MADIFVSYSQLDQARVQPIVERLQSLGFSVWWDQHVRTDSAFPEELQAQLDGAKAVLAVWTENTRNATWTCAEAARALDQRKLLQLRLDNAGAPAPFDALTVADMRGRGEWGPLEAALARVVREGEAIEPEGRLAGLGPFNTPAMAGAPKLSLAAMAAALAAFTGAMNAALNGMMPVGSLQIVLTGVLVVAIICALLSFYRLRTVARAGG